MSQPASRLHRCTILLVDDEQDIVETLRYSLEREGYATLSARSGAAAMNYLGQSHTPDLVLLDWMLPDMSGTEVCRNQIGRAHV